MFKEEIKAEIKDLVGKYKLLRHAYAFQNKNAFVFKGQFSKEEQDELNKVNVSDYYHKCYVKALRLIHVIIPEREADFINYNNNTRRVKTKDFGLENYDLTLGIQGIYQPEYKDPEGLKYKRQTVNLLDQQIGILQSALDIMDSKIYDLRNELQYDMFMSELDAAEHLLKNKFIRAAGAMCGVVLEGHLKSVCLQHEIKITKKDDLSKYNDHLKNNGIIKQTSWRKIQYLTDIRNSCDHKRDVEPTADQVLDLVNGTKQIIAEVA